MLAERSEHLDTQSKERLSHSFNTLTLQVRFPSMLQLDYVLTTVQSSGRLKH